VAHHAKAWDSGVGARTYGGRWNGKGAAAVYCALDPATAVLEVAVHKGFDLLDSQPHVLTCARLDDSATVHVARDARNVVRVVTGRFCPDGARDSFDCHGARRAAITHIYPPLDGTKFDFVSHLPEMDIELNGAEFNWKDLGHEVLRETLLHELGHVFGLQHSCQAPECSDEARRALMYPYTLEAGRPRVLKPTPADCLALE
jgi:hypothetical protein